MEQRERYSLTLSQAAETLGGASRLAAFLHVPQEKLAVWLAGEELAPLDVFLRSLDLIADGPYAPVQRPIRVGVIKVETT